MHVVIWEYTVRPGAEAAFERLYGPDGEWVALFRGAPGYLGTELLRAAGEPARYLTIDRWRSGADHAGFHRRSGAAYAELDRAGEALTAAERRVGEFVGAADRAALRRTRPPRIMGGRPGTPPPPPATMGSFKLTDLRPGDRLRVIRAFTDFDGVAWREGQLLELVDSSYFPYDGGYTFDFREGTLRLAHLDGGNDRVLRRPEEYFARVPPEPQG